MRAILTYHSVDGSGSPVSVDAEAFGRHVAWLASGAVKVVALEGILEQPPDADALAITFDDGFTNFAELAWPRLREHGLPATLFVPTGCVGGDNSWGGREEPGIPKLPLLDWEAYGRLAEEGLALGSHSRTHRHLTRLAEGELAEELEGSAADLEQRTGRRPRTLCYPYGDHDERVARAAGAIYRLACTTELRALEPGDDPLGLPRLDAFYYRDGRRLEEFGSAGFRRHLWVRARARALKARVRGLLGA